MTPASIRFFRHVEKTDTCWLWRGAVGNHGYGVFLFQRKTMLAHRVIRIILGLDNSAEIYHHTCRARICVNPAHTEPSTRSTHIDVGLERKPLCKRGHPMTKANLYVRVDSRGYTQRNCIACRRLLRGASRTETSN